MSCAKDERNENSLNNTFVQMLINIKTTEKSLDISLQLSSNINAEIDWGDGTLEKFRGTMKHTYTNIKKYTIKVKGEESSPTLYIDNIENVENIDFPLEN